MDYKSKIIAAIEKAEKNMQVHRVIKDNALKAYYQKEKEEEVPVRELIKQYLFEELKDRNGSTVSKGCVITNERNHPAYLVLGTGMQVIFGTPIFNPSAEVVTYKSNQELGKKKKRMHKSELKDYTVLFMYEKEALELVLLNNRLKQ